MATHPRPFRILAFVAVLPFLAGCDVTAYKIAVHPEGGTVAGAVKFDGAPGAPRARTGHDWFPMTPGRYVDFEILRYPDPTPRYLRATFGAPESFFDRVATPWVYGPVPWLTPDSSLLDLRQYWSVDEVGNLRMHGSENKGIVSYMEPPIRHLPPAPQAGQVWIDTTFFQSFFPGMIPIFAGWQTYESELSARTFLGLDARPAHALQRRQFVEPFDGTVGGLRVETIGMGGAEGAALAEALLDGESIDLALAPRAVRRGHGASDRPPIDAQKGIWYARQQGVVARDYPHGPGQGNINITTYERIGTGVGPLPAAKMIPEQF